MKNKQEYLSALLKESITFSKRIFVIIDIPEKLDEYFFMKFYNKDTERQNKINLNFWQFSLIPVYLNVCVYLSKQKDLKQFMESQLLKGFPGFPINYEKAFPDYVIDFLKPDIEIDQVLYKWNPKGIYIYYDLISFVSKNMSNANIPYQTAMGLWFVYNLSSEKLHKSEIDKAPILGSFIIASIQMNKIFNPNDFFDIKK